MNEKQRKDAEGAGAVRIASEREGAESNLSVAQCELHPLNRGIDG